MQNKLNTYIEKKDKDNNQKCWKWKIQESENS